MSIKNESHQQICKIKYSETPLDLKPIRARSKTNKYKCFEGNWFHRFYMFILNQNSVKGIRIVSWIPVYWKFWFRGVSI